ncbi:cathepsin L-like [Procambarus clarkii]|uniref:cathepsin L-like n=1 Tax=Procambarus clarkii TaxID=6728 RepID=UPI003744019E
MFPVTALARLGHDTMKYLTASVFVAVLAVISALPMSSVLDEWEAFKLEHGKKYATDAEDSFRMKIFIENKNRIDAHNKLFAARRKSYSLRMNKFGDMLPDEFMSTLGGFNMYRKE